MVACLICFDCTKLELSQQAALRLHRQKLYGLTERHGIDMHSCREKQSDI